MKSFIDEVAEAALIPDSKLSEFPEVRKIQEDYNAGVRDTISKMKAAAERTGQQLQKDLEEIINRAPDFQMPEVSF